jgi:hypothetical protein
VLAPTFCSINSAAHWLDELSNGACDVLLQVITHVVKIEHQQRLQGAKLAAISNCTYAAMFARHGCIAAAEAC